MNKIIIISSSDEEDNGLDSPTNPIIMSIDVGYKNFGLFIFDPNEDTVLEWKALDLSVSKFKPDNIIHCLKEALEPYLSLSAILRNNCRVIIEKQTQMLNVHKVVLVDLALRAWLSGRGVAVETVDPKRVKGHFYISEKKYKKRKAVAVERAQGLIGEWPSSRISDALRNSFMSAKKKDDMADALLQCVYFQSQQ
jgi:hypothetical protein